MHAKISWSCCICAKLHYYNTRVSLSEPDINGTAMCKLWKEARVRQIIYSRMIKHFSLKLAPNSPCMTLVNTFKKHWESVPSTGTPKLRVYVQILLRTLLQMHSE